MAPPRSGRGVSGRTNATTSPEFDAASGVVGEIGTSPAFDKQCNSNEQQQYDAE